jgi:hypothetical protein
MWKVSVGINPPLGGSMDTLLDAFGTIALGCAIVSAIGLLAIVGLTSFAVLGPVWSAVGVAMVATIVAVVTAFAVLGAE